MTAALPTTTAECVDHLRLTDGQFDDDTPCGGCDGAGIYTEEVIEAGYRSFGHFTSRDIALAAAPRCRHRPDMTCVGSRHFIDYVLFPQ